MLNEKSMTHAARFYLYQKGESTDNIYETITKNDNYINCKQNVNSEINVLTNSPSCDII